MCVILHAGWPALLVTLSFLLSTNISDALFGVVLGALQSLVWAAGGVASPMPRDAFFTALSKAALPSCVVTALDRTFPASSACLPATLEGGLAGRTGPPRRHGLAAHETQCACVRSSSSRFSLQERLTQAGSRCWRTLTTPPQPAAPLLPPAPATVGATPNKRGGAQTDA